MASITDKLDRVTDSATGRPIITTLGSGKASGAASISLSAATNWTTTTPIHFAIYTTTSAGIKDPTSQTDWKGVLVGTTVSSLTLTGGTDRDYTAGAYVEITPTARFAKDLYDWGTTHADVTGLLIPAAVQTAIGAGGIVYSNLSTGVAVQSTTNTFSAVAIGSTLLPYDDTVPQITEGTEFMTLAFTPKATTDILTIDVIILLASTTADFLSVALFQDATANALAATTEYQNNTNAPTPISLTYSMTAGTISPITFRVRAGTNAAATMTFNGAVSARKFGAVPKSSIKVTEFKA